MAYSETRIVIGGLAHVPVLIFIAYFIKGKFGIKIEETNDDALLAHLANPALGVYLEAHADLGTDFSVEFYGTVGDKVIEAMNGTGVPYKIFKTKLGYSRV